MTKHPINLLVLASLSISSLLASSVSHAAPNELLEAEIFSGSSLISSTPAPAPAPAPTAHPTPRPTAPLLTKWLEGAIGLSITPKGQQYLYQNTGKLLIKNGIPVDKTTYPEYVYKQEQPLTQQVLENMLASRPGDQNAAKMAQAFEDLQTAIKTWLTGYELKDPQLQVKAQTMGYRATFTKLGIRVDVDATRALRNGGIVLMAEAETSDLGVYVKKVRANDLRNSFLGIFGIDGLWLTHDDTRMPLQIQIPIEISIDARKGLMANVPRVVTNIDKLNLNSGFTRLVLPEIVGLLNGHEFPLDSSQVVATLNQHKDGLVKSLQVFLKGYAKDSAPAFINGMMKQMLDGNRLGVIGGMKPIYANAGVPDTLWGIQPSSISMREGSIFVEARGMSEDPRDNFVSLTEGFRSGLSVNAQAGTIPKPAAGSDVSISVHDEFVNRMLQLSFLRGYFKTIDLGGGESIELISAPKMVFSQNSAVMQIDANYPMTGGFWQDYGTVVGDKLHVRFNINVRFIYSPHGLKVRKGTIDQNSIWIDTNGVRFAAGSVRSKVNERMAAASKDYQDHEQLFADPVALPNDLFHLPLHISGMSVQPGYLSATLNFDPIR